MRYDLVEMYLDFYNDIGDKQISGIFSLRQYLQDYTTNDAASGIIREINRIQDEYVSKEGIHNTFAVEMIFSRASTWWPSGTPDDWIDIHLMHRQIDGRLKEFGKVSLSYLVTEDGAVLTLRDSVLSGSANSIATLLSKMHEGAFRMFLGGMSQDQVAQLNKALSLFEEHEKKCDGTRRLRYDYTHTSKSFKINVSNFHNESVCYVEIALNEDF